MISKRFLVVVRLEVVPEACGDSPEAQQMFNQKDNVPSHSIRFDPFFLPFLTSNSDGRLSPFTRLTSDQSNFSMTSVSTIIRSMFLFSATVRIQLSITSIHIFNWTFSLATTPRLHIGRYSYMASSRIPYHCKNTNVNNKIGILQRAVIQSTSKIGLSFINTRRWREGTSGRCSPAHPQLWDPCVFVQEPTLRIDLFLWLTGGKKK